MMTVRDVKIGKSMLARALWAYPDDTKIVVGLGIISPDNKTSNLYKLLKQHKSATYVVGGRAGKTKRSGHHFAVIID